MGAGPTRAATKGRTAKRAGLGCLGCVGLSVGLMILLAIIGTLLPRPPKPPKPTEATTTAPRIPPEAQRVPPKQPDKIPWLRPYQMVDAYQSNEVWADELFKNHQFAIKGRVVSVGKDIAGAPYMTLTDSQLSDSDSIRRVQAYFAYPRNAINFGRGQNVVLICEGEGLAMNVIVKECRTADQNDLGKQWNH